MSETSTSNLSIDRMLRIIELMSESGKPMRLNEIAESSGVSTSTAMRILNTLIEKEYAKQDQETLLYALTMKFLKIGTNIRENLAANQLIHPYLQEITKRLNLSCALAIQDDGMVVYIDESVSSKQMLRFYHHLGHAMDMYNNASGKLFLAHMTKDEFVYYCRHHKFLSTSPKSITNQADLAETWKKASSAAIPSMTRRVCWVPAVLPFPSTMTKAESSPVSASAAPCSNSRLSRSRLWWAWSITS